MLSGSVSQYPLTTTTTTAATLATKSRDLDSMAASYESVSDVRAANRKSDETTSGENGTGSRKDGTAVDAGCDWVVSPGWRLRKRVATDSETNKLPVGDRKSIDGDDNASSGGQPENIDDVRSQSAQGKNKFHRVNLGPYFKNSLR